jgi:hypothetical protein
MITPRLRASSSFSVERRVRGDVCSNQGSEIRGCFHVAPVRALIDRAAVAWTQPNGDSVSRALSTTWSCIRF